MDCTVVAVILRKRFDSFRFWAFRILSGMAEPAYADPVYTGIFYDVLQIPQYVASKGVIRKICDMTNSIGFAHGEIEPQEFKPRPLAEAYFFPKKRG